MTSQRKRAIAVYSIAVLFALLGTGPAAVSSHADLGWKLLLAATLGLGLIATALLVVLHLVEANDAKAAEENLARIAVAEAYERERQRMKRGLVR